jgi:hypothetical protein
MDSMFPSIDFFLHRPAIVEPPLCTLRELQDGTYSLLDLLTLHEIADLKQHYKNQAREE